jgi:hypothetical protein
MRGVYIFLIGVLGLALASLFIGNFWMIFIFGLLIVGIGALVETKIRNQGDWWLSDNFTTLALSILIAVLFLIGIPYLLFGYGFFSIFAIQYLYLFPVMLIFTMCLYLIPRLFASETIDMPHIMKKSFIMSVLVSVILTMVMLVGVGMISTELSKSYNDGLSVLKGDIPDMEEIEGEIPSLQIFSELKNYGSEKIIHLNSFEEISESPCYEFSCIENVMGDVKDMTITSLELVKLEDKINILKEEYVTLALLSDEEISSKILMMKSEIDTLNLMPVKEFTFDKVDFREIKESNIPVNVLDFEPKSLLEKSLLRTVEHTNYAKVFYGHTMGIVHFEDKADTTDSELFREVFYEKDTEESLESKYLRYKLLESYVE